MHCPHCGEPLQFKATAVNTPTDPLPPWIFGFEFRSKGELLGLPLLHVATGINPCTGLPRLACGIIAIGNFALGVVAIGGIAAGGFVLSGIGLGVLTVAGIAVGWAAVGGLSLGIAYAVGGLAISAGYAIGGLPLIVDLIR